MFFRTLLLFSTLTVSQLALAQTPARQIFPVPKQALRELSSYYLGLDLYGDAFSRSLGSILNKGTTLIDTLIPGTDSTALVIKARRGDFNPFGVAVDSVFLLITEMVDSSSGQKASILVLTVAGITYDLSLRDSLHNAFQRICEDVESFLPLTSHEASGKKKKEKAEAMYFRSELAGPPLVRVIWGRVTEKKLSIGISFRVPFVRAAPAGPSGKDG